MKKQIKVPELGENIDSAEVSAVLIEINDIVEKDQPVIEVESDKATVEIPAPSGGKIVRLDVSAGQKIKIGQVIAEIETEDETVEKPANSEKPVEQQAEPDTSKKTAENKIVKKPVQSSEAAKNIETQKPLAGTIAASPAVRRQARELGVDLHRINGSGRAGRITYDDIKNYVKQTLNAPASSHIEKPGLPDFSNEGETSVKPFRGIRKRIGDHMHLSWNSIPHVTQFEKADITGLEDYRKKKNIALQKSGGPKLTMTAFLVKIATEALKKYPVFNASLDEINQQIIFKNFYHIGIAADTPKGLLVPVIRGTDQKGVVPIAEEMQQLAQKARDGKASPQELSGSTFSISNLGSLGTAHFTPIINWPEVAVLGVGEAKARPEYEGDTIVKKLLMPLSISYDHRVIDGADAARFLHFIAESLKNPIELFFD